MREYFLDFHVNGLHTQKTSKNMYDLREVNDRKLHLKYVIFPNEMCFAFLLENRECIIIFD